VYDTSALVALERSDRAAALLAFDGDVIHTSDPADLAHLVAVLGRQVEVARV